MQHSDADGDMNQVYRSQKEGNDGRSVDYRQEEAGLEPKVVVSVAHRDRDRLVSSRQARQGNDQLPSK